jgi:hypothetical protein
MGSVDGFLIGFLWVGHVLLMFIYSGQVRTSAPKGSLPGTVMLAPLYRAAFVTLTSWIYPTKLRGGD